MASIKLKGDTSGEVTIQAPAVAGTTILNLPATSSTLATQNSLGVRNLIINGDMRIAQRGTSATGLTSADSGYKTVDRWRIITTAGETRTDEQSTDAPNDAEYSFKTTITTADTSVATNEFCQVRQVIEGLNSAHLRWGTSNAKTITVSFWVKSSVIGTYCLGLGNDSFLRQYIKEYTINSANTWEKKTITIIGDTSGTWDTDNGRGVCIYWSLACGPDRYGSEGWQTPASSGNAMATSNQINFIGTTTATFQLALAQLEVGENATPFEHRPYDMELARCLRYYETGYFVTMTTPGTSGVYITVYYKEKKRANPTVTTSRGVTAGNTTVDAFYQNSNDSGSDISTFTSSAEL